MEWINILLIIIILFLLIVIYIIIKSNAKIILKANEKILFKSRLLECQNDILKKQVKLYEEEKWNILKESQQ